MIVTTLSRLRLHNFRNYASAEINFGSNFSVITGHNGAGKTNLLEAISLLTPGKGLKNSDLKEIGFNGSLEWGVAAEVGGYTIGTGLELGANKRIIKINGERQKGTGILAEFISCVWLTPQMDGIFLESSSSRRRFFDRIIYNYDPTHASRVTVYENAMSERLRLLKTGRIDPTWLKVLEKRMAEYGVAVAAARNEVIGYLQHHLDNYKTTFPKPLIEIRGKYESMLLDKSALEVEQRLFEDLFAARQTDAATGRNSVGVQKTDFFVTNKNKNLPASISSTGEQKALLLSIILALAEMLKTRKNKTPLVLLDEVIAHLDESRREELFTEIAALGCQSFMTGTDEDIFANLKGKAEFIRVNAATVKVAA